MVALVVVAVRAEFGGKLKARKTAFEFGRRVLLDRKVAHVGDLDRVGVGFRQLGKEQAHFLLGLKVPVVQVHVAAHLLMGLGHNVLKADAAERVLGLGVFFFHIVNVVGNDHRNVQVTRELD